MSTGKILAGFIVISAIIMGAGLYYTQVYAYYQKVAADAPIAQMRMTAVSTGLPEAILANDVQAIESDSSPIRFRACFTTPMSQAMLTETFEIAKDPVPLTAPGWFDCFDAMEIGTALQSGDAMAFLSERDIHDGVDRVIAVFPDGRAFAWHQLNEKYKD